MRLSRRRIIFWVALGCLVRGLMASQPEGPLSMLPELRPGFSSARTALLSEYHPPLKGTPFDTPVFFLGEDEGPSCLVLAGSHANEIAGVLAACWLIERASVHGGRLIILPRSNASGATWSVSDPDHPRLLVLGSRVIPYGYRLSNPRHESVPDPPAFLPPRAPAGLKPLPGREMRNLNRQFPGSSHGSMTAQTAYAIMQLLLKEGVDVAFDLHEAGAVSSLAWSLITKPEYMDNAALAALELEETTGTSFHLEHSREEFAGYSHWEWGMEGIRAFLIETFNPAQPDDNPAVDQVYHPVAPLARRVFVHLRALQALLNAIGDQGGCSVFLRIEGLPRSASEVQEWLEGAQ